MLTILGIIFFFECIRYVITTKDVQVSVIKQIGTFGKETLQKTGTFGTETIQKIVTFGKETFQKIGAFPRRSLRLSLLGSRVTR